MPGPCSRLPLSGVKVVELPTDFRPTGFLGDRAAGIGQDGEVYLLNVTNGERLQVTDDGHPKYEAVISEDYMAWRTSGGRSICREGTAPIRGTAWIYSAGPGYGRGTPHDRCTGRAVGPENVGFPLSGRITGTNWRSTTLISTAGGTPIPRSEFQTPSRQ